VTSPVLQAIENAKLAERETVWQRNETAILETLKRQFGEMPLQQTPAMMAALSAFLNWCEAKVVRSCPAKPATVAQFALENASLGIDLISEVLDHIANVHEANGLANPVATWIVAEAMDRIDGNIQVPRSWPKEHWWRFNELPCIIRRYLVQSDKQQEKVIRRAQNEAATARQDLASQKKETGNHGATQTAAA
jgi:hypothetical protein